MSSIYSVYKVTNIINGKCYIGFATNYPNRKLRHKSSVKNSWCNDYNVLFHKAIRKYGMEYFIWEIIYQSQDKVHCLKDMEPFFIKEYNSYYKWENGGYNMTLGGDAPGEYVLTPARIKAYQAQIGKPLHGVESKLAISIGHKGKPRNDVKSNNIKYKSKTWLVPINNREIIVTNLKQFSFDNKLSYGFLRKISKII